MITEQDIGAKLEELRGTIDSQWPSLLTTYPINKYVDTIADMPHTMPYREVCRCLSSLFAAICAEHGPHALALYHKLAFASFLKRAMAELPSRDLPEDVRDLYLDRFDRIMRDFSRQPDDFYDHSKDLFCKDLGVASLRMIPVGCELVEISPLGRRYFLRTNPRQIIRGLPLVLSRDPRLRPLYYRLHLDDRYREELTQRGQDLCYLRVAELLKRNRSISGLVSGSWFYDPQLRRVSPRLGYLRRRPIEGGAVAFRVGTFQQDIRLSTLKSETRKRLYEQGAYRPVHYLIVWNREELLAWADAQARRIPIGIADADLEAAIAALERELASCEGDVLRRHPVQAYIEEIHEYPLHVTHRYLSPSLKQLFAEIEAAGGRRALALYCRLAICYFLRDAGTDIKFRKLPESVIDQYRQWFLRIFGDLSRLPDEFYDPETDSFCKDLGVASLRLIPVGFLVDVSGLGKRILFEGGAAPFFSSLLYVLFVLRGLRPLYGMHLDQRYLRQYWSEEGWQANYRRIAELLELNPRVKGLCAQSWFYDPALERISPAIAHLSRVPCENGGRVLRLRNTAQTVRLAMKNSPLRTKMYLDGTYRPAQYAIVWPRKGILRWAARAGR